MATRRRAPASSRRAAAARKAAVEVLAAQRRDIAMARDLCRTLLAELDFSTRESEAIEAAITQTPENDKRQQTAAMRAISLAGRAVVLRDLANATRVLIELERGAFDLGAGEDCDDAPARPAAIDSINAGLARLAPVEAPTEL